MTAPQQSNPVPRWVYDPPAEGPRVVHESLYDAEVKGKTVPGGFVVVDKPSGLLAVPGIGPEKTDCTRSRVQSMYPWATGPMTPHRLDLSTSGVMILALDRQTHRNLSIQFEQRKPLKRYVALVEGHLDRDAGVIDVPMRKDMDRSPTQLVDWNQGKPSQTEFTVLARETLDLDGRSVPVTRLELRPITGRTHQLRVHCSHPRVVVVGEESDFHLPEQDGLGAPIVGDDMYSGLEAPRLMLHACSITFYHPMTGRRMSVWAVSPF
ncbi:MAG: RNA pseudouridine synthase [Phycisphaeraceae bacterium]|nr:MAG: RNA pseudouridine synthase [Phycisphaeraceae bacterium]